MVDWIPVVSQTKSAVQAIFGDCEGAKRTQENFSRQCPVVSQVRSAVEAIAGDEEAARETQYEFGRNVSGIANAIPVVGHVKGAIHYAVGDNEGGDNAMKSASRTVGVMAGGAAGFVTAGPPGAVLGGIAGGDAMDLVITGADSAVHGEFRPYGYISQMEEISENPTDPGNWFDTVAMVAGDGACGYAAGKATIPAKKFLEKRAIRNQFEAQRNPLVENVGMSDAKDFVNAADRMRDVRTKYDVPETKPHVTTVVRDLENNKLYEGHNQQIRKFCSSDKFADAEKMSNYTNPGEPTNLQKRVPQAVPPLKRNPNSCAEQRAYHKYYKENPNGNPQNTHAVSVRYNRKENEFQAVRRCDNCVAYGEGMGEVPGDMINGLHVPNHPGIGKYSYYKDAGKGLAIAGGGGALEIGSKSKNHVNHKKKN
ncbi:uncharacterized protein LOC134268873 [Saccostrea cucullata]|uniref:uncharacterized protein LOC134268873 n=1 Tax=Saccostrea cuccullata TaxID=36930 RepID=UPI002ED58568